MLALRSSRSQRLWFPRLFATTARSDFSSTSAALRFLRAEPYRPMSASMRSPSFLGNPSRACPALRPRRSLPCGRYCLPPFLTASASTNFFTGLNHTARHAHCLRFGPGIAPGTARLASSCAFGLGWAGLVTRRVSSRGFSSWQHPPQPDLAGAPGRREGGVRALRAPEALRPKTCSSELLLASRESIFGFGPPKTKMRSRFPAAPSRLPAFLRFPPRAVTERRWLSRDRRRRGRWAGA